MKYKVGDKVRIRSDLEIGEYYGCYAFMTNMNKLSSNIVTIKEVLSNRYHINEDEVYGYFEWTDEMFEDIKEELMDNNTLQINMNNLTDEERTTLLSLVEKANKPVEKVWKPKNNELYYILKNEGTIIEDYYTHSVDKRRYLIGNCFKTREEAEFALERQKVITELKRYALEHNEKEIDWYNHCVLKYYIQYDYVNNKLNIVSTRYSKSNISSMYFTSDKIAQSAIKAVGEDRIKKYYFEVND